jgi:hypothetical protein
MLTRLLLVLREAYEKICRCRGGDVAVGATGVEGRGRAGIAIWSALALSIGLGHD